MRRRNFFIPDDLMADAAHFADMIGISVADFVRLALTKYVEALKRASQSKAQERKS